MIWNTSRYAIDLQPARVMGIVNVTPDSFSDGGALASPAQALRHCEQLLADGADLLDIGGESSRPGALPVSTEEELSRVLPVLREAVKLGVPISVDTYKPAVMQAALDLGVDIINDIWALRWRDSAAPGDADGRAVVSRHGTCGVCLMHMHREPQTMQTAPLQGNAVPQVLSFLEHATLDLQALGVNRTRIVVDPGIGFGKTAEQNFALLQHQQELLGLGFPLLVGWSRKSSLGSVCPARPEVRSKSLAGERLVPSVVAAVLAVQRGAGIVRVHDVFETVQALHVLRAAGQLTSAHSK